MWKTVSRCENEFSRKKKWLWTLSAKPFWWGRFWLDERETPNDAHKKQRQAHCVTLDSFTKSRKVSHDRKWTHKNVDQSQYLKERMTFSSLSSIVFAGKIVFGSKLLALLPGNCCKSHFAKQKPVWTHAWQLPVGSVLAHPLQAFCVAITIAKCTGHPIPSTNLNSGKKSMSFRSRHVTWAPQNWGHLVFLGLPRGTRSLNCLLVSHLTGFFFTYLFFAISFYL